MLQTPIIDVPLPNIGLVLITWELKQVGTQSHQSHRNNVLYCRNGCVDDEIHLLTECDIHTEIRQRFVSNIKTYIDGYEDFYLQLRSLSQ